MIRILSTVRVCVLGALFAAFLLPSCAALAKRGCAQHDPDETERRITLGVMRRYRYRTRTGRVSRTSGVVVDVYWHTIRSGNQGKISEEIIKASIDVLNNAFDSQFSFQLVATDTTDNSEYWGIDIDSRREEKMKKELHKGGCGALNIYSTALVSGLLGWATFPNWCKSSKNGDGVVIQYSTSPGVSKNGPFNEGHTLTHEVGHWLGLYHTFEGGCSSGKYGGDQVADTPEVRSYNTGCPNKVDSCPNDGQGDDMINNFMDYTDDSCMNTFTPGQRERMNALWDKYRAGDNSASAPTSNIKPTNSPTINNKQTDKPTKKPTKKRKPTKKPRKTNEPTNDELTNRPTKKPTKKRKPTKKPTQTNEPTNDELTNSPTKNPTKRQPTQTNEPTKKTSNNNKPTNSPMKSPKKCLENEIEFKVVIETDSNAGDDNNRFYLRRKKKKGYDERKIFLTEGLKDTKKQTFRKCLQDHKCFRFTIEDDIGDGICCESGKGWYELYKNDVKFNKSKFENGLKEDVKFCAGGQQV